MLCIYAYSNDFWEVSQGRFFLNKEHNLEIYCAIITMLGLKDFNVRSCPLSLLVYLVSSCILSSATKKHSEVLATAEAISTLQCGTLRAT